MVADQHTIMKDLEELLNTIYADIRKQNCERGPGAIPQSDRFYDYLTKTYSVIPYGIPKLIKILVDTHKIFSFNTVEANSRKQIRRVEGLVVAEGNIIKKLLEIFGDELMREFSHEFSKKYSIEKIIKEFVPKIDEYNNTPLGRAANIVINLMSIQSGLERAIMQYNPKWQEKQLKIEIEKCDGISAFIEQADKQARTADEANSVSVSDKNRRITDMPKYEEFKKYISKNSIEKTLVVYGAEFYSRVCFREYQFSLMQKIIEDGKIEKVDDLRTVKKMLQKTRANSDQDQKLQKFAHDINDLEKVINQKIKMAGG